MDLPEHTQGVGAKALLRPVAAMCACALLLAGCAVGPDHVRPDSGLQDAQLSPREEHGTAMIPSSESVPALWWTLFNDVILTELQTRASRGNVDLQMAAERIQQARALLSVASAQAWPGLSAGGSHARERISEHGKFAALGAPARAGDFWQVAFDASWEIDLWGRVRRERESASAALEAVALDREATRVALAAEVARTYLRLRGTQALLDVADQNVAVAEGTLGIAESRERHGVGTRFETSTARAQLANVRALVPELMQRRNALMNALALLQGETPRALDALLRGKVPLPALPASVPVGVSSELARRRPDIRRAEAQLHAATAAIGVARADFYPRIRLTGRFGVEAFESGDLDAWGSRFFSVGPTVSLPLFQGGRLTANLKLSEARQRTAALAYRQTVLRAWHEVDDALDACAAQQRRHAELEVSYEQSRRALQVAQRGYQEGATDYLSVLTAQRNLLASQTSLHESATGATLSLVNLYKSLGGGWNPGEPEAGGS